MLGTFLNPELEREASGGVFSTDQVIRDVKLFLPADLSSLSAQASSILNAPSSRFPSLMSSARSLLGSGDEFNARMFTSSQIFSLRMRRDPAAEIAALFPEQLMTEIIRRGSQRAMIFNGHRYDRPSSTAASMLYSAANMCCLSILFHEVANGSPLWLAALLASAFAVPTAEAVNAAPGGSQIEDVLGCALSAMGLVGRSGLSQARSILLTPGKPLNGIICYQVPEHKAAWPLLFGGYSAFKGLWPSNMSWGAGSVLDDDSTTSLAFNLGLWCGGIGLWHLLSCASHTINNDHGDVAAPAEYNGKCSFISAGSAAFVPDILRAHYGAVSLAYPAIEGRGLEQCLAISVGGRDSDFKLPVLLGEDQFGLAGMFVPADTKTLTMFRALYGMPRNPKYVPIPSMSGLSKPGTDEFRCSVETLLTPDIDRAAYLGLANAESYLIGADSDACSVDTPYTFYKYLLPEAAGPEHS